MISRMLPGCAGAASPDSYAGRHVMDETSRLVCGRDAVRFAKEQLDLRPDAKQALVLSSGVGQGMLNCSRQWGKSTVTAVMAVHGALFVEESLVLSPSERQSAGFLRKAGSFLRKLRIPVRGDGDNDVSVLVADRGAAGEGEDGARVLEGVAAADRRGSRVEDDLYDAVRPMLAVSDGDLWLMSTPYGRRGFFYDRWVNGDTESGCGSRLRRRSPRIKRRF